MEKKIRDFRGSFRGLVNTDVPRNFMRSQESRSGYLNEADYGVPLSDCDENLELPKDGFIARYCKG